MAMLQSSLLWTLRDSGKQTVGVIVLQHPRVVNPVQESNPNVDDTWMSAQSSGVTSYSLLNRTAFFYIQCPRSSSI
jgi:hypothetical protein